MKKKSKLIYPVLTAIMSTKQITLNDIAEVTGQTIQSVYNKINGKTDWTLKECKQIKVALDCKESIDVLFFREVLEDGKNS